MDDDQGPRYASNLLLREAYGGDPVLDGSVESQRSGTQRRPDDKAKRTYLWSDGRDPQDLTLQRWGVIAPLGDEGDALLDAIKPLLQQRRRDQGDVDVRVDRLPPDMDAMAVLKWRREHFDRGDEFRLDLPRYQLILGDLHQISPEVQMIQAASGAIGRLAFDTPDDYRRYVDKLLAWERAPRVQHDRRVVVHTVRDGTASTGVADAELVRPGVELLRSRVGQGDLRGVRLVTSGSDEPAPVDLSQHATIYDPGVFFTVSHGEGAPRRGWRSPQLQRSRQGAMSFGTSGSIGAAEVGAGTWMPGALWMMFACFSAGTPKTSKFARWLETLAGAGEFRGKVDEVLRSLPQGDARPFVAALPKAALLNEHGPLGFVGHLDLAWTYSFRELRDGRSNARPARFMAVLRECLGGSRYGLAFREIYRYFDEVNTELSVLEGADVQDPARRGHLWMLRQDLAGYVLLGDPAARLPVREPAAEPARSTSVGDFFAFQVQVADTPKAAPIDLKTVEKALADYLRGESIDAIARRLKVDKQALQAKIDRYQAAGREALKGDG
ncbi:MAG: hypothetical protein R3B09_18130 [Nannocystaceae bacterium]